MAIVVSNEGEIAKSGDFLNSEIEESLVAGLAEDFSGVGTELGTTLKAADTLLVNLNNLVADESEEGLKSAIAELNTTMKSFQSVAKSITSLVSKNDDKLASVLTNFDSISQDLSVLTTDLKND